MPERDAASALGGEFAAPRHVAIIMDGNGRWAAQRGLPRVEGHRRGAEALRRTARAARRAAEDVAAGKIEATAITAEALGLYLDAPDVPDPDLIIRTSGEQRLSNFLMWQAAYSELVFVPIYWPDFDRAALEDAILEFRGRERRFGGLVAKTGS